MGEKPKLAANLDALDMRIGGPALKIDQILLDLPTSERTALERALKEPKRATPRAIAALLTEAGISCSASAVVTWRQKNRVGWDQAKAASDR
jgi:hypothetical protein